MRTEYELRNLVIGHEGSKERRWLKCEEEVYACAESCEFNDEFHILKKIQSELGGPYTLEQIEAAEPAHWRDVLTKQSMYELNAFGRVSVETQRKANACGFGVAPSRDYIADVERRFVENCKPKVVVCIPSAKPDYELEKDANGEFTYREFDHLMGFSYPTTFSVSRQVFCGYPTAHAYNIAVDRCFELAADFMLTIEDDHIVPKDAFMKILDVFIDKGPKAIVSAWYRQRHGNNPGACIVNDCGTRSYLEPDDKVHECYVVPNGFTLIPMSVFLELPKPWFVTTPLLTQDSFFCQLAREKGYKLWCDTSVRLGHVDRTTGKVV